MEGHSLNSLYLFVQERLIAASTLLFILILITFIITIVILRLQRLNRLIESNYFSEDG